jgi:uncharacterized protein
MRVIISGGAGLIGSALATSLLADGFEVILLSRRPAAARHAPQGARVEQWDGHSAAGWGQLANGAYAIINLAGENLSAGRWTAKRKQRIMQSRVDAGQAVLAAIAAATNKPDILVQASGIGHYGMHADDSFVTEANGAGDDFGARVTVAWEHATAAAETMGVRRVIVRMAPVLSTSGGALPQMMLPFRFFVGGRIGSGRQWFSWLHMADCVGAIRFLMANRAAQGAYNLCAPNPVSNATFSKALGRAMHRPSLIPVPALALRLLFGEMSTILLDGQRGAPERLRALGYTFRFNDIEAALRDVLQ